MSPENRLHMSGTRKGSKLSFIVFVIALGVFRLCVTGCKVTEQIKEKYLFIRSFTRLIVTLKNQMGGEVRFDPACFFSSWSGAVRRRRTT